MPKKRFELAFSQIGGSVPDGRRRRLTVGGAVGLIKGVGETKRADFRGAQRRTQILNYVTERSAATAQMLGVVALMYSVLGVIISKCLVVEGLWEYFKVIEGGFDAQCTWR